MAKGGNKFARMLQRNGHKMTVILVYTILEWVLMCLLLLKALFSYLITRFALYFGLKPPCLLCSRVDDLFYPPTGLSLFPDLICEDHVVQISALGYCPVHRTVRKVATGNTRLCRTCSGEHLQDDEEGELKDQPSTCSCCGALLLKLKPDREKDEDLILKERSLDDFFVATDTPLKEVPVKVGDGGEEEEGEKPEKDVVVVEEEKKVGEEEEEVVVVREREADVVPEVVEPVVPEVTSASPKDGSNVEEQWEHKSVQASEEEIKAQIDEGGREPSECASSAGEKLVEHDDGKASDHSGPSYRSISRAQSADSPDELLDTPRSVDSSHAHGTDKRDYRSESVDSSVTSEMDSLESLTRDQLEAKLRALYKSERNAYAELEEERTAFAISTNQMEAMISRLQEEKAEIHMAALQYHRETEEQSEYEIEAWHKEKAKLEKKLEIYRAKVLEYEAKEGKVMGSNTDGIPDSIHEDAGLGEDEEELCGQEEDQYMPIGDVLSPKADKKPNTQSNDAERLLDNFENDRLAILEQVKSLAKRISSVKRAEKTENHQPSDENPDRGMCKSDGAAESHNETSDASIAAGGDLSETKKVSNGKTILPCSDASVENGEGQLDGQETGSSQDADFQLDLDEKPLTIEEEVEELYWRIQDLEDDRDFIKLCIRFLKNGDTCMNLLEEILGQLRNVRTAETTMGNEANIVIEASA